MPTAPVRRIYLVYTYCWKPAADGSSIVPAESGGGSDAGEAAPPKDHPRAQDPSVDSYSSWRLALVALLGLLSSRASGAPLHTGFLEEQHELDGPHAADEHESRQVRGATTVRYLVYWNQFATAQPSNARNPDDPAYDWTDVDNMVVSAHARGCSPSSTSCSRPSWAERSISGASYTGTPRAGTKNPDPAKFGDFAFAAAKRYDGSPLPRGSRKYWQAWNETNYPYWLLPQYNTSRKMVSARHLPQPGQPVAANVHAVHSTNFVIAGGTAPWGHKN